MDWTASIDAYCERVGPAFWAEPINAMTSFAFLVTAALAWRRMGGDVRPIQGALLILIVAIGIGSFLFHTVATPLAGLADTLPILLFITVYVFAANRDLLGLGTGAALAGAVAVLPLATGMGLLFTQMPFFEISAVYWPLPILTGLYAAMVPDRAASRGLAAGTGLLILSVVVRSYDIALCNVLPSGTHFIWHLLNATTLTIIVGVHSAALVRPVPAR